MFDKIDDRVIDWGVAYLERRLPACQLDGSREARRNIVCDLMFASRHFVVEPDKVRPHDR